MPLYVKNMFQGSAQTCNSLKQDFLHKPTLQSEHRQIDSISFFCNEQAARRLLHVGI